MKFCWLVGLWLLTTGALAQHISGRVIDLHTQQALAGANVYLLQHWRVGTSTDNLGNFTLELPPALGSDSLVVSYVGYQEQVLPLQDRLEVTLSPQATLWEEVIIKAKPLIAEEFKYLQINKLQIYTNPSAKADPILAVNSLPSATTTDESANISLRGSTPVETGIFLNNVPIYDAVRYSQLNGIGTFSLFNTSIIKQVTVFPGNPPLEFGNTTSGIISLQTDDRIIDESGTSVILSLANLGFNHQQKISTHQSLKVFGNYQPSGAMKKLNEQSLEDIESFQSVDLGIYWYGTSGKYTWKLLSYSLSEGYEFNFNHPSYQGIFDQSKVRSFAAASVERSLKEGTLTFNSGANVSDGDFRYSNVSFNVLNKDLFAGLNYQFQKPNFHLKAGLNADHRSSKVDGTIHQFGYALGPQHPTDSLHESTLSTSLEMFTYFKYYFNEYLVMGTGLRLNIPTGDQNAFLSRQLNLSYNHQPWSLTLGLGKYHKHGIEENTGSLLTVSSSQWSLDARYERDKTVLTAALFGKRTHLNDFRYDLVGTEIFMEHQFHTRFKGSLSFTWIDAQQKDSLIYPYDLRYFIKSQVTYKPAQLWTIEGTLLARDGVSYLPVASSSYVDEFQVYQPGFSETAQRRPSYLSLGISVSKVFLLSDELSLIAFASVNNFTDHQNVRNYQYSFDYTSKEPNLFSQRTAYFGVVINF